MGMYYLIIYLLTILQMLSDREIKETLLYNSLPKHNNVVISWRDVNLLYLGEAMPQLSNSLIKIIGNYIGGVPFDEYFTRMYEASGVSCENYQCNYCTKSTQGNQLVCYLCVSYMVGQNTPPSQLDINMCNLCWPYGAIKWIDGGHFIKWYSFYKNPLQDPQYLQKLTFGTNDDRVIEAHPQFWMTLARFGLCDI